MSPLRFYILTSRNLYALERHFDPERSGVPMGLTTVVINTQSSDYREQAVRFCCEQGIDYEVTESNGTAARGKNSVLDLFKRSNNRYMVLIDGDDYVTPHGINLYRSIASIDNAPDAICLRNQVGIWFEGMVDPDANPADLQEVYCRVFRVDDWEERLSGEDIRKQFAEYPKWNTSAEFMLKYRQIKKISKDLAALSRWCVEGEESFCRVSFLSQRGAETRFDEGLLVGEDAVHYMTLKDRWANNAIEMHCLDEEIPTYVYDMRLSGAAVPNCTDQDKYIKWTGKLLTKMKEMDGNGMLHHQQLPLIKLRLTEAA